MVSMVLYKLFLVNWGKYFTENQRFVDYAKMHNQHKLAAFLFFNLCFVSKILFSFSSIN